MMRWLALAALLLSPATLHADAGLLPLARPGPWSGVSGLIGYGGRLWFVNSVKFVDHNSADVWSYDPRTGAARYERHLFSQDAGDPVVAGGLLYWPFEDGRFSADLGEYAVTDGRDWQWRVLPRGEAFHVHAMALHGTTLWAATSAWHAGLQRSDDGGLTWRVVYEHPTAAGFVSRITTLAALGPTLYAGLTDFRGEGVKLLRVDGDRVRPAAAWPPGEGVSALVGYRGWLYGVNVSESGSAVWRTDGARVERVAGLDGGRVRRLADGGDALWAVSADRAGGTLWRSADGVAWRPAQRFADAEPSDVAVYAGRVYVGTIGPGGRGTLWGPPAPAPMESADVAPLPPWAGPPRRGAPTAALAALDHALADGASYARHGAGLRRVLLPLALDRRADVGAQLTHRLDGPFPPVTLALFGGKLRVPAAKLARWHLLWALALNGHGRVPPRLIAEPWTAEPNRPEKYLEPAPAAAWAAAELRQADEETLAGLVARLGTPGEPAWLDGDWIGALTALTGERFGYDVAAWRRWWAHRAGGAVAPVRR